MGSHSCRIFHAQDQSFRERMLGWSALVFTFTVGGLNLYGYVVLVLGGMRPLLL